MTDTTARSLSVARGPVVKLLLIAALTLALLIPLALVRGLIVEREGRQISVEREIGELWGRAQRIGGPILVVPARRMFTAEDIDGRTGRRFVDQTAVLLPDDYRIDATVRPETLRRGLFEAVVYRLDVTLSGRFVVGPDTLPEVGGPEVGRPEVGRPEVGGPEVGSVTADWSQARLALGLSDQRSIREAPVVEWPGGPLSLTPGLPDGAARFAEGGMQAAVPGLDPTTGERSFDFAITVSLAGSDQLSFLPLGRTTEVTMASDWPHPSFFGRFLPEERAIAEDGFTARWQTSYFGRSYPQVWGPASDIGPRFNEVERSAFGVRFFQPVDAYQQTERTVKYGLLFIVFTFTALFLFETLAGTRIHIVQYGLVGLALALFYMLLLALTEQIGFTAAYALGALAVVAQIAFYTAAVLADRRRTAGLALLLAALYAGLWVLMRLEDYALLVGALALFVGLTVVMAVTRRVDWSAPKMPGEPPRKAGDAAQGAGGDTAPGAGG